jgi:hypothetical protein
VATKQQFDVFMLAHNEQTSRYEHLTKRAGIYLFLATVLLVSLFVKLDVLLPIANRSNTNAAFLIAIWVFFLGFACCTVASSLIRSHKPLFNPGDIARKIEKARSEGEIDDAHFLDDRLADVAGATECNTNHNDRRARWLSCAEVFMLVGCDCALLFFFASMASFFREGTGGPFDDLTVPITPAVTAPTERAVTVPTDIKQQLAPHVPCGDAKSAAAPRVSECPTDEMTLLADKYETDKGSRLHNYTEVYNHFMEPMRTSATKVFEIGIRGGLSLRMWRDYFPNAMVYGVDINDERKVAESRIKVGIADQAKREQLKKCLDEWGSDFDVILDDGGHTCEQQQISFGYLFKYVKPGGLYIIEDCDHEIWDDRAHRFTVRPEGTLSMVFDYVRFQMIESKYMTKLEKQYATQHIAFCNLLKRNQQSVTCIIKKR